MSQTLLIKNATIINEGQRFNSDIFIRDGIIEQIAPNIQKIAQREINAEGLWLVPGAIDDQVHFREPGLTHKANIYTEAKAAVAGGVTSFMEMPNTNPPATTQEKLEEKYAIGKVTSLANYSFFMGVANNNVDEVLRTNDKKNDVCGVKIFMGSSTGDMLVDNFITLNKIFGESEVLIATHCEDEKIIKANKEQYAAEAHDASYHPIIRNEAACFESSFTAVQLAKQNNSRLHILHITTAKELQLFTNMLPLKDKRITSEVCVHHLHFTADDYATKGNLIQCNPAIKAPHHRDALWEALLDDRLDVIATDHAPHTWEEKQLPYGQAPSGLPLVQHSLPLMMKYAVEGKITPEKVVEKMAHHPAICFEIENRGFIREGYAADIVLLNPNQSLTIDQQNIYYKCGWSPLEGMTLPVTVATTIVNGHVVYENGIFNEEQKGQRLRFTR